MKLEILILLSFLLGNLTYGKIPLKFIFIFLPLFFHPQINKKFLMTFICFFLLSYFLTSHYEKEKRDFNLTCVDYVDGQILSVKNIYFEKQIVFQSRAIYTENKILTNKYKFLLRTKSNLEFLPGEIIRIKSPNFKEISQPKNPFETNYKRIYERKGIFFEIEPMEVFKIENDGINIKLLLSSIRKKIEKRIENNLKFNPDGQELIKILTIGNDDTPQFLKEIGIRCGIYHLFVISGIHIVFLIFFIKIFFIPLQKINNIYPKLFPFFLLILLWIYAFICGFAIPVTRSVLMFSFYLLFEIIERKIEPIDSLFLACFAFLILDINNIYSLSFQLSFLSTLGIILFSKKINLRKSNFLLNSLIATISAQLLIMPILLYNFGYFYPLGFINNLIFTPLIGFIIFFSFLSLLLPIFFPFLNILTEFLLKILTFLSNYSPKIKIYFPFHYLFLFYILLFNIVFPKNFKRKIYSSLIILFFSILLNFSTNFFSNNAEIIFFSFRYPAILLMEDNKSLLIVDGKVKNRNFFQNILFRILQSYKIKPDKIIVVGDEKYIENIFFLLPFSKKIYCLKDVERSNFPIEKIQKKIALDKIEIINKNGNLILIFPQKKILFILNNNLEEILEEKYFLVYFAISKIEEKNIQRLKNYRPLFLICHRENRKLENLKKICKILYLQNGSIILKKNTNIPEYYLEGKDDYR